MSTPVNPADGPAGEPVPEPAPSASPSDAEIRSLATQLAKMSASEPGMVMSQGVITAWDPVGPPPVVSLTLSGSSTEIANVQYVDSYSPVVGDTVLVIKQGGQIAVLGQIHTATTGAASGWLTPTLSSGFTTNGNSNGNLQYRLVLDNGEYKVQWRGSVSHSGTNLPIVSGGNALAVNFRPSAKRSIVTGRDVQGGLGLVQIDFGTDGTVTLVAATGPVTSSGSTDSANLSDETTNNAGFHQHQEHDGFGTFFAGTHNHAVVSSGNTAHSHGLTVDHPTWITFNGIEYFL